MAGSVQVPAGGRRPGNPVSEIDPLPRHCGPDIAARIMEMRPTKNAQGWDTTFATDYLGPFVLTEALVPHLPDSANVVFVCSGVEDPRRRPAVVAGFRGGRYIFLGKYVLSPVAPFVRYWSTPARAAKVITNAVLNETGENGVYYDERGKPILGSTLVREPEFQDRVVTETRALLSTVRA